MKKFIAIFSFLTIVSCTSKEVVIEEIPFMYENSNAQPSLVSKNGSLSYHGFLLLKTRKLP